MQLNKLEMQGFRSFMDTRTITLHRLCSLIAGRNAAGKTNMLEAIYTLLYGVGFRTHRFDELFSFGVDNFSLRGEFSSDDVPITASVKAIAHESVIKKSYLINGNRHLIGTYRGRLPGAVLFEPEDLRLVTGPPDVRREYIDKVLSLHNTTYAHALERYQRGLYRRNKTLERMGKEGMRDYALLEPWNKLLEESSAVVQRTRASLVERYNRHRVADLSYRIAYLPNPFTAQRILEHFDLDCRIRRTTCGPQRDDFIIFMYMGEKDNKPVASYGARSEQRLAVLWLKAQELAYVQRETGTKPLFLLDDIFSELDTENSARVMHIADAFQTIITTAHKESVPELPEGSVTIDVVREDL